MLAEVSSTFVTHLSEFVWVPPRGVRHGSPGAGCVSACDVDPVRLGIGVPAGALLRMTSYVGIDLVISAIPLTGWASDVFYRSFLRNMAFLREHLDPAHLPRTINSTMLWPLLVFVMGVSP